MSDLYQEILIKKETTAGKKLLKLGIIAALVLLVLVSMLLSPFILVIAVVLGFVAWMFLIPRLDVEYEYLYVNGELDIDVIYSKQKRKKVASYDIGELEVIAPANSHALDSYKSEKVRDFTSGKNAKNEYIAIYNKDGKRDAIKVELNDTILNDMRRMAPRKVNLM